MHDDQYYFAPSMNSLPSNIVGNYNKRFAGVYLDVYNKTRYDDVDRLLALGSGRVTQLPQAQEDIERRRQFRDRRVTRSNYRRASNPPAVKQQPIPGVVISAP